MAVVSSRQVLRLQKCDTRCDAGVDGCAWQRGRTGSVCMSNDTNSTNPALKAVILAAGKDATTADGQSLVLKKLGDHTIVEYVVQTRCRWSRPRTFTWSWDTGSRKCAITSVRSFITWSRRSRVGTGDAVLQVCEDAPGLRGQPADPLRRHALVSSGIDSGVAQSTPPEAGPPDAADRGSGQAHALWANHSQRRRADHRHHRGHRSDT